MLLIMSHVSLNLYKLALICASDLSSFMNVVLFDITFFIFYSQGSSLELQFTAIQIFQLTRKYKTNSIKTKKIWAPKKVLDS